MTSPTVSENFVATLQIPPLQQFIPITTATGYGSIIFTVASMISALVTREPIPVSPKFILLTQGILLNQEKYE